MPFYRRLNECVFLVEELRPLIAHANTCDDRARTFGQEENPGPGLWLVHDDGVYLMSNGRPGLIKSSGHHQAVYAQGMNPHKDQDWYDVARTAVGGDDFCDFIPIEHIEQAVATGAEQLILIVGEDDISVAIYTNPERGPTRNH